MSSRIATGFNAGTITLALDGPAHVQQPLFALDIGGSLAKVAYLQHCCKRENVQNVTIHLISFLTQDLDDCLTFIKQNVMFGHKQTRIMVQATGVGCTKYHQHIADALQVDLQSDAAEMEHSLRGVDFLWRHLPPDELLYEGSDMDGIHFHCPIAESGVTPCIVVNMGSALTINRVEANGSSGGLVGGSCQGGLTFLGLGSLLTNTQEFEELVQLAKKGNRKKCDLLVKDTAGSDYNNVPSDFIVSSFGKAARQRRHEDSSGEDDEIGREDIASSLLYLITEQMAQTAYLVANCQKVNSIIFCGSFLSNNASIIPQIKEKLAVCSSFLQTEVRSLYMKNEGYAGSLGILASQYYSHLNHNSKIL